MKKKIALAVCAPLVAAVFSLDPAFGSGIRLDDSRGLGFESVPQPTFVYGAFDPPGSPANGYIAEVRTSGFLLCNYFEPVGTSSYEQIYLRPRHGAWVFGDLDMTGVTGSVRGVRSLSYQNQQLNLDTCSADGSGAGCGGAALQCYVADAHGLGVADTRSFFYDGFDALTSATESSVSIVVTHWPTSGDDTFNYSVTVNIPSIGQNGTQSLPGSQYILKHGYDTAIFEDCSVLLSGGQLVTQTTTFFNACSLKAGAQVTTDVPVVSAALFTNAQTVEQDYSDNVAFGYPVVTQ